MYREGQLLFVLWPRSRSSETVKTYQYIYDSTTPLPATLTRALVHIQCHCRCREFTISHGGYASAVKQNFTDGLRRAVILTIGGNTWSYPLPKNIHRTLHQGQCLACSQAHHGHMANTMTSHKQMQVRTPPSICTWQWRLHKIRSLAPPLHSILGTAI